MLKYLPSFYCVFLLFMNSSGAPSWPADTSICARYHRDLIESNALFTGNAVVTVSHSGGSGSISFATFLDQMGSADNTTYLIKASPDPYVVGCRSSNIGTYAGAKRSRIVIRGETGNRSDVVLVGADPKTSPDYWKSSQYGGPSACGSYQFIQIYNADHVVIADLTMRNFPGHMIKLDGGYDNGTAWYPRDIVLHNLEMHDCGDQLIKGASNSDASSLGCVDGVLECSYLHYTDGLFPQSSYETQGIDLHEAHNWDVRDNVFENLRIEKTAAAASNGAGVLMWDRSDSIRVERNLFINCNAAVKLGASWYLDACDYMTAVNNLVVYNDPDPRYEVTNMFEIGLDVTRGGIYHNTIWNPAQPSGGTIAYCPNDTFPFKNNLYKNGSLHRIANQSNNVVVADSSWFKSVGRWDFHLTANHTVPAIAGILKDIEQKTRAATPSAGAYEYGAATVRRGITIADQASVNHSAESLYDVFDLIGRKVSSITSNSGISSTSGYSNLAQGLHFVKYSGSARYTRVSKLMLCR